MIQYQKEKKNKKEKNEQKMVDNTTQKTVD
jgi:hypothetical protein